MPQEGEKTCLGKGFFISINLGSLFAELNSKTLFSVAAQWWGWLEVFSLRGLHEDQYKVWYHTLLVDKNLTNSDIKMSISHYQNLQNCHLKVFQNCWIGKYFKVFWRNQMGMKYKCRLFLVICYMETFICISINIVCIRLGSKVLFYS